MKILVLNGPNLNLLGIREPEIYGRGTYEELIALVSAHAAKRGAQVEFFQSNHEGALVDAIQNAYFSGVDGIVFNPAAYTHTSIAIADAVKAVGIPTVEVHLSDVDARESYRRVSYLSEAAIHTVKGRGFAGYTEAMDVLIDRAREKNGGGRAEKQPEIHSSGKCGGNDKVGGTGAIGGNGKNGGTGAMGEIGRTGKADGNGGVE